MHLGREHFALKEAPLKELELHLALCNLWGRRAGELTPFAHARLAYGRRTQNRRARWQA